jgi:hypothetical protein
MLAARDIEVGHPAGSAEKVFGRGTWGAELAWRTNETARVPKNPDFEKPDLAPCVETREKL